MLSIVYHMAIAIFEAWVRRENGRVCVLQIVLLANADDEAQLVCSRSQTISSIERR